MRTLLSYCPGTVCDPCVPPNVGNLAIVGVDRSAQGYPGPRVAVEWTTSDGPLYQLVQVTIVYTVHAQDKQHNPVSTIFTVKGMVTFTGGGSGAFLPLPLTPLPLTIDYVNRLPMYAGSFVGYSIFLEASTTGPDAQYPIVSLSQGPNFIATRDDGSTFNIAYGYEP